MEKSQSSAEFDTLRAEFPAFGFAVYAYTPGAEVTIEVSVSDELIVAFGATLAEACANMARTLRPIPTEESAQLDIPAWAEPSDTPPDIFG